MPHDAFIDPSTGQALQLHPGAGHQRRLGRRARHPRHLAARARPLGHACRSAGPSGRRSGVARRGFVVDPTFREQTAGEQGPVRRVPLDPPALPARRRRARRSARSSATPPSPRRTGMIARRGIACLLRRPARPPDRRRRARTRRRPRPTTLPVPTGFLEPSDLRALPHDRPPAHPRRLPRATTSTGWRRRRRGGSTVGEALNILEQLRPGRDDRRRRAAPLPRGQRAGLRRPRRLRRRPGVRPRAAARRCSPTATPHERACQIERRPRRCPTPVAAGDLASYDGACGRGSKPAATAPDTENLNTTNLTVADRWGNVVEYTLTIEQTGGSGIVVPGRGFLLNNELTDFTAAYDPADPNRIEGGKRPRSSISPTIVLRDGKPFLALGSPGGSTIITTVLQMLVDRIDRGMTIEQAIADPRGSQRNTADGHRRAVVHRRVRRRADAVRLHVHPGRRPRHHRRRDRGGDGDRVRPAPPAHRGLRTDPPRRRHGPGGPPRAVAAGRACRDLRQSEA